MTVSIILMCLAVYVVLGFIWTFAAVGSRRLTNTWLDSLFIIPVILVMYPVGLIAGLLFGSRK